MSMTLRLPLMTLAVVALLAGCGPEEPPLDALPLRDALLSDPSVISALSAERRQHLAERLEDARRSEPDAEEVRADVPEEPARQVAAVDSVRRSADRDALVVAALHPAADTLRVRGFGAAGERADVLPPLEGSRASATAGEEDLALSGRAGRILAALLRESGARRLVRVSAWPCGAVAAGDAVYVNASWLVAMAALEERDGGTELGTTRLAMDRTDTPYQLHPSVSRCVEDVLSRCQQCRDEAVCNATATLHDFRDMQSECDWLAGEASRPTQLCVAGFLSLDRLAQCMRTAPAECATGTVTNTVSSLEQLAPFVSRAECIQNLDLCISGKSPTVIIGGDGGTPTDPPDNNGGGSSGGGSCSVGGSSCSAFSGNNCSGGSCSGGSCSGGSCSSGGCSSGSCSSGDCSSGSCSSGSCSDGCSNSSCGSCSGSGGSGGGSGSGSCSGGGGGGGGGSCGSCGGGCQVAPTQWEQQAEATVTYAWVLAPLIYLAMRRRLS